ncbi:MAG: hypothetical protein ABI432_12250, partial [Flavobacteriales bacterium]
GHAHSFFQFHWGNVFLFLRLPLLLYNPRRDNRLLIAGPLRITKTSDPVVASHIEHNQWEVSAYREGAG